MLRAGPRITPTFSARHSSPMACPIRSISSGSKQQEEAAAGGKQVAGTDWFSPRWSASPACFLSPWGPSVSIKELTPSRSTALLSQKFFPEHREAFSSSVICATSARAFCCNAFSMILILS